MIGEHLGRLLLEALRDEDVGVEEPLHAVPHAVFRARVEFLGRLVVLRAGVPALLRQLVDDRLGRERKEIASFRGGCRSEGSLE